MVRLLATRTQSVSTVAAMRPLTKVIMISPRRIGADF
jgi:energy-converting hydrogenase Eha subunit C